MNKQDIIDAINTLTDPLDLSEIGGVAYQRRRWAEEEALEPKRLEMLYNTLLDFPPGSRVKCVGLYYRTMEGRTGTITQMDSERGYGHATAHVKLDKGKGPLSIQCAVHTGCVRLMAGSTVPSYKPQIELIE